MVFRSGVKHKLFAELRGLGRVIDWLILLSCAGCFLNRDLVSMRVLLITVALVLGVACSAWADVNARPLNEVVIYPKRSASATALSLNDTTISAQIMAIVSKVHVRVSQPVKRGDKLLDLDCADYQLNAAMAVAKLAAARAQLLLAQSQFDRSEQLLAKSLTSQEQLDTRAAERVAQQAMLKQRQVEQEQSALDVSRCTVRAPFDGVVTNRLVSVGQLANVGTALLGLVETGNLELSASVSYDDAALFGEIDQFVFDYGRQVPVQVLNVGGVVDSTTRNRDIRFLFAADKPLPGTAGKLLWHDPRPFIPARFIVNRNGQLGVFVDQQGLARFVPLLQAAPGRPAPTALPLTTLLVTEGMSALHDGTSIKGL